jgi:SRSO17 transposase
MGLGSELEHADRFAAYVDEVTKVIGHADREGPFRDYCAGLLATEGRRGVEPMAVVTDPGHVSKQHQKLLHLVAESPWSDEKVLAKVREQVVPSVTRRGPIEAWIIDDTGIPKKGTHSVGVHHQYCGQLGKQANCQVTVTLSIANHHASLPIAYRLYLPREWCDDAARRKKAHVPASITFKTKPQIALEQIRAALLAGIAPGVVLMDAGYGNNSSLRQALTGLGLTYVAAIQSTTKVRPVREDDPKPPRVSVEALALSLPKRAWRTVAWREGTNVKLRSRFARVRVRAAPIRGEARFAEETRSSNGPSTRLHLPSTGSQTSTRTCCSAASSISPRCAGVSSAIMKTSSRKPASGIMRAAAGRVSIITARCASQPTVS